jgi:hypothetical protein
MCSQEELEPMWNDEGEGALMPARFEGGGSYDFADSGAAAETFGAGGAQQVVNYYFPVEVIVEGGAGDDLRESIQRQIFAHLTNALERMT